MKKVFIDGSAGTTGLRIRERLSSRRDLEPIVLPEAVRKDSAARADALNAADVAFLCLHGKMGEDGTVQGMLELFGIPYTCSHVQASAIAMDKAKSKIMYERAGVRTPRSLTLVDDEGNAAKIREEIGVPCVIKPATEGSALGVEIINDDKDIELALQRVFEIDDVAIVEEFIKGTEVTVAILGNEETEPLPVIQIVPMLGEFYDFESKYADGGSKHICPAPIDEEITQELQRRAAAAHKALGCSGVSRSDFIIDETGEPWILETNTIPGMTATSLLPDAARAAGISFPELCTKLIEFALE